MRKFYHLPLLLISQNTSTSDNSFITRYQSQTFFLHNFSEFWLTAKEAGGIFAIEYLRRSKQNADVNIFPKSTHESVFQAHTCFCIYTCKPSAHFQSLAQSLIKDYVLDNIIWTFSHHWEWNSDPEQWYLSDSIAAFGWFPKVNFGTTNCLVSPLTGCLLRIFFLQKYLHFYPYLVHCVTITSPSITGTSTPCKFNVCTFGRMNTHASLRQMRQIPQMACVVWVVFHAIGIVGSAFQSRFPSSYIPD